MILIPSESDNFLSLLILIFKTIKFQLLKGFKEEVQCIESNRKNCDELVEKCRKLATKEVSLNISLSMAKEAMNNNLPKEQNCYFCNEIL